MNVAYKSISNIETVLIFEFMSDKCSLEYEPKE
jgi:hypothetical protein